MTTGFEWVLILGLSLGFTGLALAASLWLDGRRAVDARALSALGERVGLRYRVLGRDHLELPEPFVLHERSRSVAENSVIERSLVSKRADGLPAVFEYVTYRDRAGLRRSGAPFLVLAARLPDGIPDLRLRPPTLVELLLRSALGLTNVVVGSRVNRGRGSDAPRCAKKAPEAPDWQRFAASGLWIQAHARTLYIARLDGWWRRAGFTPSGIDALVHEALPLLQAVGSPDVRVFGALAGSSELPATRQLWGSAD